MKKTLFAMLLAFACTLSAKSQTKGTNAIGLGVGSFEREIEYTTEAASVSDKQKDTWYSLSYGRFVRENVKVSIAGSYSHSQSKVTNNDYANKSDGYGGSISYQHYYVLLKRFYAYAGGRGGYSFAESKSKNGSNEQYLTRSKTNSYDLGAYGGFAYFLSKRFAFEAQLLSAKASYIKEKAINGNSATSYTTWNVNSSGSINNLGFNIYFLF